MSAAECPMCEGDGYRDGCEVCGRFTKVEQDERDRPKREAIEAELARLEARFESLKAQTRVTPPEVSDS